MHVCTTDRLHRGGGLRAYAIRVCIRLLDVAQNQKNSPAQFACRGIRSNIMNKSDFIKELESKTQYTAEQCAVINDVLENHFVLRKKNKPKIVTELSARLGVDEAEADSVYETSMSIIKTEMKHAVRRPLGSKH